MGERRKERIQNKSIVLLKTSNLTMKLLEEFTAMATNSLLQFKKLEYLQS